MIRRQKKGGHLSACRIKVFFFLYTIPTSTLPFLPFPPRERSNRGEGHKTRRREKETPVTNARRQILCCYVEWIRGAAFLREFIWEIAPSPSSYRYGGTDSRLIAHTFERRRWTFCAYTAGLLLLRSSFFLACGIVE